MSQSKELGPPKPESPSGRERRVRVRYPTDRELMCQPGDGRLDQVWWLGRVADISTTGIALVLQQLRQKFPAGTLLTVELQNWAGDVSRTLPTRVVHMTPNPEGGWLLGCAFEKPLTEEDLKALL
jgi:hypothetical protein